jgi:hypothetical protein
MTTKTEAAPASPAGERAESFKEEVRSLKIKDPNANREGLYVKLGLAVMVVGVVVAIVGYFVSHNTASFVAGTAAVNAGPLNDAQMIGMIGIALTIAGGVVFLRYSIAGFLRFWLARFLVEQQREARD